MATTTGSQIYLSNTENNIEISKQEIQAAIAKAVELRALHASLRHINSPANLRLPTSASPSLSHFSAQDYPIFTPSYEGDSVPAYQNSRYDSGNLSENWDGFGVIGRDDYGGDMFDDRSEYGFSRKGLAFPPMPASSLLSREFPHYPAEDDHKSVTSSCRNHVTVVHTSPSADIFKSSRRTNSVDLKIVTTCNTCRPAAIISSETENSGSKISKNLNHSHTAPLSDTHSSVNSHLKNKGFLLSRLFPRLRRKGKSEASPNRVESEDASQIFKDLGIMSVESLKRKLMEANENRDAALMEASEMKSSLGDLKDKLEHLEAYCEELKKALKQAVVGKDNQVLEQLGETPKLIGKESGGMPLSHEAMVEGFLQIVSEARLSVKQFCKTLVCQIEETDNNLMEKLNALLQPYRLNLNSKHSKVVLYHLEALINQSLYQDFENCVFQKNGTPKFLDPQQDREAQFSSFVSLRNLSWNEVLRKGTKYYSEEFSKFCDQKMSCIIATVNWTRPWPEQLLQAFFVAAKCIWLLHLLTFSFNPALGILRIEDNRNFDSHFMEDMFTERQRSQTPIGVKIMVMPGFFVHDKVLKCKVLCRYRPLS